MPAAESSRCWVVCEELRSKPRREPWSKWKNRPLDFRAHEMPSHGPIRYGLWELITALRFGDSSASNQQVCLECGSPQVSVLGAKLLHVSMWGLSQGGLTLLFILLRKGSCLCTVRPALLHYAFSTIGTLWN